MNAAYKWKIVMVGDISVGKTSLVRRFVFNEFSDTYLTTIGVKVTKKEIAPAGYPEADLLLWDIAGSDKFADVSQEYINGAAGGIIVTDITRKSSIENISRHAQSIYKMNPDIKIVAALNKGDLSESHEDLLMSVKNILSDTSFKNTPVFITSAKEGRNVEELFLKLYHSILEGADK